MQVFNLLFIKIKGAAVRFYIEPANATLAQAGWSAGAQIEECAPIELQAQVKLGRVGDALGERQPLPHALLDDDTLNWALL